eukprot:CAMPEP_0177618074 /NCGR_PEP_ID=MMETSP0419_2-20121207/25333_1 /TAXON_ID=582737 /ORGANISM="Tetraselmis sp., Strain GSL018" /LENGTH=338 /DNA_ID=CAMNT_0019116851 /DNA_START=143 /DNA_END=1160 /DNA_ORIENTATION=+
MRDVPNPAQSGKNYLVVFDLIDVRKDNLIDSIELKLALEAVNSTRLETKILSKWISSQSRAGKPFSLTTYKETLSQPSEFLYRFETGHLAEFDDIHLTVASLFEPSRLERLLETKSERTAKIENCPLQEGSSSFRLVSDLSERPGRLPPIQSASTCLTASSSNCISKTDLSQKSHPACSMLGNSGQGTGFVDDMAAPVRGHTSAFEARSRHSLESWVCQKWRGLTLYPGANKTVSGKAQSRCPNEVDSIPMMDRIKVKPERMRQLASMKKSSFEGGSTAAVRSQVRRMEMRSLDSTDLAIRDFHNTSGLPALGKNEFHPPSFASDARNPSMRSKSQPL